MKRQKHVQNQADLQWGGLPDRFSPHKQRPLSHCGSSVWFCDSSSDSCSPGRHWFKHALAWSLMVLLEFLTQGLFIWDSLGGVGSRPVHSREPVADARVPNEELGTATTAPTATSSSPVRCRGSNEPSERVGSKNSPSGEKDRCVKMLGMWVRPQRAGK